MTDRHIAGLDGILELVVLLGDDQARSLARDGLTVSRARVLWEQRQRGPTIQRDLADALRVSARTITGLVDGLVATGFLTRQPHPTDRRASLITVTARGASTVEAMERDQRELAHLLFAGMPGERFDCFVAGLGDILTRLRDHGRAPERRPDTR